MKTTKPKNRLLAGPAARAACIIVMFAAASTLEAETVMVQVSGLEVSPDMSESRVLRLLAAVEDGAMEYFFDAGHIVFNGSPVIADATQPAVLKTIAREGGARYLLEIRVAFAQPPGADEVAAVRAEYTLTRLLPNPGREATRGDIPLDEFASAVRTRAEQLAVGFGSAAAAAAEREM